jgi:uncharacterized heparinase superfamily protein
MELQTYITHRPYTDIKHTIGKLWDRISGLWLKAPALPDTLFVSWQSETDFIHHDVWHNAQEVKQGIFHFLNQTHTIRKNPNQFQWYVHEASTHWHILLHAFGYIHLLDEAEQVKWCKDWIHQNPIGQTIGWQKEALSLRIANWCKNDLRDPVITESLYQQVGYLFRRTAWHEQGVQILFYARALILAGIYFQECGEADEWLQKGIEILKKESKVQILPDGAHLERNPMLHTQILEIYLDVVNVLSARSHDKNYFAEIARKMANFLVSILHPDGQFALFNASAHDGTLPPRKILDYVNRLLNFDARKQNVFSDSGFFIHHSSVSQLIVNKGNMGHKMPFQSIHNDIFSYELWLAGEPIVIDNGGYALEGDMQKYTQSAKAHNTVTINGRDPIRTWRDQLLHRKYIPYSVSFTSEYQNSHFEGTFDGYTFMMRQEISHKRVIDVNELDRVITVRDNISGSGQHIVESRVHLHPDINLKKVGKGFQLQQNNMMCHLITNDEVWIEKGWYCPKAGTCFEHYVLVLRTESLPASLEYQIRY